MSADGRCCAGVTVMKCACLRRRPHRTIGSFDLLSSTAPAICHNYLRGMRSVLRQKLCASPLLPIVAVLFLIFGTTAQADFAAGWRAYQQGNFASALQHWTASAEAGDQVAQYNVGDTVRIYDYQPMADCADSYLEGVVRDTVAGTGHDTAYPCGCYEVEVTKDAWNREPSPAALGKTIYVPYDIATTGW